MKNPAFASMVGKPVNMAPWGYLWRRDCKVQPLPEAYFIPHRLKRQDEVYRTAKADLGEAALKPWCYIQNDIMEDQIPAPKDPLLTGLLWFGGVTDYEVTLVWPKNCTMPDPATVEVRTYPTAWGWFGWTLDKVMPCEKMEGNEWTYPCLPDQTMDHCYSARTKAATEMIAVFAPEGCPVPEIRITGGSLGEWKELTFTVEWGFTEGVPAFEGKYETHVAYVTEPIIDKEAKKATFTCLYSDVSRYGLDSRITIVLDEEEGIGATVLLRDLVKEPICVPEAGLFFCPASTPMRAEEYIAAQKAQGKKKIREFVSEHREAHDWEELMRNIRLWRCPDGTEIGEFPDSPAPSVKLIVPDKRWETMYNLAVEQLRGPHMWGNLSSEVYRVTTAMEMAGLYEYADKIYDYFLASPGLEHDGDFVDYEGSLEWGKQMVHGMCYAHEGSHFSTGGIIYSMMHRYFLKNDEAWLLERVPRLKKAADWIIRQLRNYMKDEAPNYEKLHVHGLMPAAYLGDYALPASDRHWYYCDNAAAYMGLNYFSEALSRLGDPDAAHYRAEADQLRADIQRNIKRETLLAPVRKGGDGMSECFLPRMAYSGGLLHYGPETNIPHFAGGICDLYWGCLPLVALGGPVEPTDRRIYGTINAMEESGMKFTLSGVDNLPHPTANAASKEDAERLARESAAAVRTGQKPAAEDSWFWNIFSNLPKIGHNSNVYLRQDDIPNFLRYFFNHAIVMVGTNGKMWEHAHPSIYVPCEDPDNGTAGWFVENFRFMLLMEEGDTLWITKGTPRAWLEQGKQIAVESAPTFWGDLTYTITSDVENGTIRAEINVPSAHALPTLKLRLRHPTGAKITCATANGTPLTPDADGETITVNAPSGKLTVIATY